MLRPGIALHKVQSDALPELLLPTSELQSGPGRVDGADFVVDKAASEPYLADFLLGHVGLPAAPPC